MDQTITANVSACLKSANHLGFTRIHNICTGATVDMPWGSADWLGAVFLSGLLLGMAAMCVGMAAIMIRDAL